MQALLKHLEPAQLSDLADTLLHAGFTLAWLPRMKLLHMKELGINMADCEALLQLIASLKEVTDGGGLSSASSNVTAPVLPLSLRFKANFSLNFFFNLLQVL